LVVNKWKFSEEKILIDSYSSNTIKELLELLPGRDADAINCKIKRLKKANRLELTKDADTIERAYKQRNTK
jgi:hypothetical protein